MDLHKGFLFCASKDKLFVDLKFSKLTDQNIGQMDTYIRLYDEQRKYEDDNPTIGLVLCSEKAKLWKILTLSAELRRTEGIVATRARKSA